MAPIPVGGKVTRILTTPALLGFFPVAAHLDLFSIIGNGDESLSARDVLDVCQARVTDGALNSVPRKATLFHKRYSSLLTVLDWSALQLIDDTLLAMGGLGLLEVVEEGLYAANDLTRHLGSTPSAVHGGIHFTTEVIFAASFLMRKLKAENFAYPFQGNETPVQYAYGLMGREEYKKMNTYAIMAAEGRYDMGAVLLEGGPSTSTKIVDIGGGRGDVFLQFKAAFPQLQKEDLVVEEFEDDLDDVPGVTLTRWHYSDESSPQPVKSALVYNMSCILHNLPDLNAVRLLQRVAEVMAPYSRILVHEGRKEKDMAAFHAAMILLYGGRERTSLEWRQMAKLAGLKVTFEGIPETEPGFVILEFRKA
ncbi:uncharacterized protein APUU_60001A [Aspergillus puulaauensis]|uniref:O-methyltransferase C-terminal domain-containing protein n=1 Tax=Aspergillus puulaauensis TaxID=1220207 RepID=A0A7R7XU64_9EURO|nr:uncharacterized protein APUU_60001A [Aspergillus puulaauensis]BCS26953.1 hypothetical protein APUU_60001A [Aspergillus puulaauensis]